MELMASYFVNHIWDITIGAMYAIRINETVIIGSAKSADIDSILLEGVTVHDTHNNVHDAAEEYYVPFSKIHYPLYEME